MHIYYCVKLSETGFLAYPTFHNEDIIKHKEHCSILCEQVTLTHPTLCNDNEKKF